MYVFLLVEKIETKIHLEQRFLTKTWPYVGSVFGTEVAQGAQSNPLKFDWSGTIL